MIRVVHPGSRIRMLTFSHPGSRGQKGTQSRIPDPDPQHCKKFSFSGKTWVWIWIQQQPGSGFSKMYGSGSGLGEHGYETLKNIKTCLPAENEPLRWSNQRFIL
jgi:hypothetical protein